MKKSRGTPPGTKMGNCIHLRLLTDTEKNLKEQATEMKIALSTYLRMYVEEMMKRYGPITLER
jgi:hypothetical protein